MLNSDELLAVFAQVKEMGKRTGLLFREITNLQRVNAADALTKKEHPGQTEQSMIDILEDAEEIVHESKLRLFWRLCTLRISHWDPKKEHINLEFKDNISILIAFKMIDADLQVTGSSLYSISDGLNKKGYPYLLPVRIGNLIPTKKVAEIDFLYAGNFSDWKALLLQSIIRCVCTKNGLSNGIEMILYSSVNHCSPEEINILTEVGFQKLPSEQQEVYVLQDLHDLHLIHATPSSLRSVKALRYCPADEMSIFGPCE